MSIDYSIIVPAYNEEEMLENTINHLKEAMATVSLKGEIVVTDNNSTDNTAEIAKNAGATVVFEPINQISRARNAGAKQAKGRYFIFVDADTIVLPDLLQNTLNNLESEKCCGGGATVTANDVPLFVKGVLGYWNLISRTFRLAAGCFVYARRDDFESCGGFSEKVYATEEVWFSIALKRKARKYQRKFLIINKPKVITSGRKLVWFSHSYQIILLSIIFIFPFVTRFKWICAYWYKRPEKKK
jgi:glycosyltransferase involved in cell wall biosynthesis